MTTFQMTIQMLIVALAASSAREAHAARYIVLYEVVLGNDIYCILYRFIIE